MGRHDMRRRILAIVAGGLAISASALALAGHAAPSQPAGTVGAIAENFTLTDQAGVGHTLYYHAHQPAVVIVTTAVEDPASRRALAALSRVKAPVAGKGAERAEERRVGRGCVSKGRSRW